MSDRPRPQNAYEILGVHPTAPPEVLKAARNALSKIYHPDNGTAPDAEAMARVNEAYDTLADPERRAIHDRFHEGGGSEPGEWEDDPVEPASGESGWGDEAAPPPPPPPPPAAGAAADGPVPAAPPPPPDSAKTVARATRAPTTPHEQGWAAAHQLVAALHQGHPLPTEHTPFILWPGEVQHAHVSADWWAFYGLDEVSYNHSTFVAGRSWTGIATTAAASAMYNRHKRTQAERQAVAQWRSLGHTPLSITNQRLFFVNEGQQDYFAYENLLVFEPQWHSYSMSLQANGGWPLRFEGPAVPYAAVILHVLLRGAVPALP